MISVSEYKSYKNITDNSQDVIIGVMIPYAQNIIEEYLDRHLVSRTNNEWIEIDDNELFLNEYPINRVIYIGVPQSALTITGDTESMTIVCESTGIIIYASPTATPTSFLFSANPLLSNLKTSIEAAGLGLTVNLSAAGTIRSEMLMPVYGTSLYYASKYNGTFKVLNNRTLEVLESTCNNGYWIGNNLVYVVYTSGWDIADIPKALKSVAINMVSDMINVLSPATNTSLKSESLGDYSYSLGEMDNIAGDIVKKYSADLDGFRKLFI